MKMKLTNRQIVQAVPAINVLNTLQLPVKASFRVAKTARAIDSVLDVYNKTLKKLQEQYAKRDDKGEIIVDGNQIQFNDREAFNIAFEELMNLENEVKIRTINLQELGDAQIAPNILYQLEWLVNDE
jgi:hypothetical protein